MEISLVLRVSMMVGETPLSVYLVIFMSISPSIPSLIYHFRVHDVANSGFSVRYCLKAEMYQ